MGAATIKVERSPLEQSQEIYPIFTKTVNGIFECMSTSNKTESTKLMHELLALEDKTTHFIDQGIEKTNTSEPASSSASQSRIATQ